MVTKSQVRKRALAKYFRQFKNPFVIIAGIILFLYALTLIYAIYWGFVTSIKKGFEYNTDNKFFFPRKGIMFDNYATADTAMTMTINGIPYNVLRLFIKQFIFAIGHTLITSLSTFTCAYVCNKYKNKFTKFMYTLVIILMITPVPSSLGATIKFNIMLNVYDNLPMIFWTCIGFNTGNFLVSYAAFTAVSWSYAESAFIDGAEHWQVYLTIMLPLVKVPITILCVLAFVGFWNNYMTPYIYLPHFPTISVALFEFQQATLTETSNVPVQMAGAMYVCLPCVILFLLFKNQMVGNLTFGGLKG